MAFSFYGCRIARNVRAAVRADREVQQSVRDVTGLLQLARINALCCSDPVMPANDFQAEIAVVGEFQPGTEGGPEQERQRHCKFCERELSQSAVSPPFLIRK